MLEGAIMHIVHFLSFITPPRTSEIREKIEAQSRSHFWDHPFKTSACLRGGGGSPLPMFANARGVGVLGLPTSAINPQ